MKFKTITQASDLQVNHIYRNNGDILEGSIGTGDVFRVVRFDDDGDPWFAQSDSNFSRGTDYFGQYQTLDVEHLGEWADGKSLNEGDKVVVLKDGLNHARVHIGDVLTTMGTPAGKYLANDLDSQGNPWEWWLDSHSLALLADDAEDGDEDEDKSDDKPVIYPAIVNGHWAILNRETGEGWKSPHLVGEKPTWGSPRTLEFHLKDAETHLGKWNKGNRDSLGINYTLDRADVVVELTQVSTPKRDLDKYTFSDGGDSLTILRRALGGGGVYVNVNDSNVVIVRQDQVVDLASALLRVAGLTPSEVKLNDDAE